MIGWKNQIIIVHLGIITSLAIICSAIVGVAAQSKSVELKRGIRSAETGSVGVSKQADVTVTHYADSENPTYVYVYAAYTGWPYTIEYSSSAHPGTKFTHTEKQDKDSTFYVKIQNHSSKLTAHAKATVSTK